LSPLDAPSGAAGLFSRFDSTLTKHIAWPLPAPMKRQTIIVAAILAAAAILLFHGYELFNFTLSIDEELNLAGEDIYVNIQQGRWGQALRILLLMPDTTAPIASIGTGFALYAGAFVLLARHLNIRHWGSLAVAAPLFFGFPTLIQSIAFADLALGLGLGALAAVTALMLAETLRPLAIVAAVFLVAFAVSLYQSLLFLVAILFLTGLLHGLWSTMRVDRALLLRAFVYSGTILGGLALYTLVNALLLKALNLQLLYVTQFANPDLLGLGSIVASLQEAASLYGGTAPPFLGQAIYYQILIAVGGVVLLLGLFVALRASVLIGILMALIFAAILCAPFLQHPLGGGRLPYRTLMALPAAIGLIALIAAEISPGRLRNFVLVPLAALVAIQFSWISNRQYYAGHWALERDTAMANEIVARIQSLQPGRPNYFVAIIGMLPQTRSPIAPAVTYSTVGASFFEWDGGNAARINGLLNLLSDAKFHVPPPDLYKQAFEASAALPTWPVEGSVAPMGNVMIVKLSEPSPPQLERLCQGQVTGICAEPPQ
jgi:hypothetical protein